MSRSTLTLGVLFLGAFVMGCAEMIVVGLIDRIASGLDVSTSEAGALVTANAIGMAVGGPLLAIATARLPRRPVLLGALVLFGAFNIVPVLWADYSAVLAARLLIGTVQGVYVAAAMAVAVGAVAPERRGRAMAVVIAGSATASAFGLPVGTVLGQLVGWQGAFAAIVAITAVVLVGAAVAVPAFSGERATRRPGDVAAAFAPRVLGVLAVCAVIFVAIQTALTYVVPYLDEVSALSGPLVGVHLALYGIATTLGSAMGGRFADADAPRTLVLGCLGLIACLALWALAGSSPVVIAVAIFGVGLFGMGMAPSMQHRVMGLAGGGAAVAAALPSAAVNVGIAVGATTGGWTIDAVGMPGVPVAACVVAIAALGAAIATRRWRTVGHGIDESIVEGGSWKA